jgi:hypothetical protein
VLNVAISILVQLLLLRYLSIVRPDNNFDSKSRVKTASKDKHSSLLCPQPQTLMFTRPSETFKYLSAQNCMRLIFRLKLLGTEISQICQSVSVSVCLWERWPGRCDIGESVGTLTKNMLIVSVSVGTLTQNMSKCQCVCGNTDSEGLAEQLHSHQLFALVS